MEYMFFFFKHPFVNYAVRFYFKTADPKDPTERALFVSADQQPKNHFYVTLIKACQRG
jgi:hypothetical protein